MTLYRQAAGRAEPDEVLARFAPTGRRSTGSPLVPHQDDATLPAGHWTARRAAADIVTLARKGRAFASLDALIARQGGQHVLYGSALALAAALCAAWSQHVGTPLPDLACMNIRLKPLRPQPCRTLRQIASSRWDG